MKIALGADHGGFPAKEALRRQLVRAGHAVVDLGTQSEESTDYPDYARAVGRAVARGRVDRGVLICGTGIGMSIAANKIRGVRAAVVWSDKTAALAAEHNGANVLCLGGRVHARTAIARMVKVWLATPFGEGRHARRLGKIARLEKGGPR
jgi:ribose 5-phosphate isomerase B